MGWIGGRAIALRDVEIGAETRNATVAVQSLDDKPISASRIPDLAWRALCAAGGKPAFPLGAGGWTHFNPCRTRAQGLSAAWVGTRREGGGGEV